MGPSRYRLHPDAKATKHANGSLLIEHEKSLCSLSIVPTDPESEPPTIEIAESEKSRELGALIQVLTRVKPL